MMTGQTFDGLLRIAAQGDAISPLAPQTGDINFMIIVAVILIAGFLSFILWKGRRKDR